MDIILFDGYCNFCSWSVRFIIRRDPGGRFRFAAAQTEQGKRIIGRFDLGELTGHSVVLVSKGRVYRKSTAALKIVRNLRGLWPVFYVLIVLPSFLRDPVYDLIARNRHRIAGRRETCFIPHEDLKGRFL